MNITMPTDVSLILDVLHDHGYEAYAVGGCIRDSILGRKPDDWDITTSATPYQVKELFRRTVDTGLVHGTVTVMLDKTGYEVTTYRIDGEYEDGRHPKEVQFTSSLTEDLKRRDFTINAMAYSRETGLIDQFGGVEDLERKIIRCVGDPMLRFGEDALRMLRAVRFAAQLGFTVEENTRKAITELVSSLSKISSERIQVETVKLLVSPRPAMWKLAYETGITGVIMPEFDRLMETGAVDGKETSGISSGEPEESLGEYTLHSMEQVRRDKVLRLTMLFHKMGETGAGRIQEQEQMDQEGSQVARKILRRLKFDNDTINQVTKLVLWHGYDLQPSPAQIRRGIHKVGEDLFPLLLEVQRACILAGDPDVRETRLHRLEQVEEVYEEICRLHQCVSLKTLAVTGKDLIQAGVKPGPQMGKILEELLEKVLEEPEWNQKEKLLELVGKNKGT